MVFPVAGIELSPLAPMLVGLVIGILAGLFGVGGGVLATPALIFLGAPPAVAVGSGLNQMIATSASGTAVNLRLGSVRPRLALAAAATALPAGLLATLAARSLADAGSFGVVISALYAVLLTFVGVRMIRDLFRSDHAARVDYSSRSRRGILVMAAFGAVAGCLAGFLGVGGGLILVPVMVYVIGLGARAASATSLMQVLFISFATTIFHAAYLGGVDVVLAAFLMIGSIPGSWLGIAMARRMNAQRLRGLFGVLLLAAAARMAWELWRGAPTAPETSVPLVGLMGRIAQLAQEHPLLYGLAASVFALTAGGALGLLAARLLNTSPSSRQAHGPRRARDEDEDRGANDVSKVCDERPKER